MMDPPEWCPSPSSSGLLHTSCAFVRNLPIPVLPQVDAQGRRSDMPSAAATTGAQSLVVIFRPGEVLIFALALVRRGLTGMLPNFPAAAPGPPR